jgi:hypothetical protein
MALLSLLGATNFMAGLLGMVSTVRTQLVLLFGAAPGRCGLDDVVPLGLNARGSTHGECTCYVKLLNDVNSVMCCMPFDFASDIIINVVVPTCESLNF